MLIRKTAGALVLSLALVLAMAAALVPAPSAAEGGTVPSWMTIDAAAKRVRLNIVAGFNANNSGLNFNGYYAGDMTVVVPLGWAVQIDFRNQDAMLPHSFLVTKPYEKDHFPDVAGVNQVAIPKAYTNNPDQGIPAPGTDTVRFAAADAGEFYFLCGAAGHAQGGMWTRLRVDPTAKQPAVIVAPGADPGRG